MILIGTDGLDSDKTIDATYKPADKLVLNKLKNANEIHAGNDLVTNKSIYSTRVNRLDVLTATCAIVRFLIGINILSAIKDSPVAMSPPPPPLTFSVATPPIPD
ncbi:hypothetical protein BGZ83_000517 [Gryganskiella cystojenkinii]|nr:hypothetical protein BGZ83_000517 [Gryganskiella cystojenkinii]